MRSLNSKAVRSAIIGINTLLFITVSIAGLYIARVILIPIALALLLAFLFSPMVSRLDKLIGRILSIIVVIIIIAASTGFIAFVLSKEFIRFANNLPSYQTNIDNKISLLQAYKESIFNAPSATLTELKTKLSGPGTQKTTTQSELFDSNKFLLSFFEIVFGSFISFIATTLLVLLLLSFILLDKEDLRGRFIRLIGQGRIGTTTQAIYEASIRVSRYIRILFLINLFYGAAVAVGLYFLGIPNAILWGAFSTILRFIPYVGAWIAAALPIAISLASASSWLIPLFTFIFFVLLEAVTSNILEPWLYGATTGVSSTALIISTLFWTLLWGPIGLVLSTPLTVCLVVLGRYVPRLEFLSVLLSDEEPLTLHEELYHRLLISNLGDVIKLTDDYLKEHSLTSLYDEVLIPVITTGEFDSRKEIIDEEQLQTLQQNIAEITEDISIRVQKNISEQETSSKASEKVPNKNTQILCLPAKGKRDELIGQMLAQLLPQEFFSVITASSELKIQDLLEFAAKSNPNVIIISVVQPSTVIQARYLVRKVRSYFPKLKIMVGLWGYTENIMEVSDAFHTSGVDIVVTSLSEAVSELEKHNKD